MKVKELIKQLLKMPQNLDVLLQGDSEGNSYMEAYFGARLAIPYDDNSSMVDPEEEDELNYCWRNNGEEVPKERVVVIS